MAIPNVFIYVRDINTHTGMAIPNVFIYVRDINTHTGRVVLWSIAASLVPAMQKGNDGARSAHIAVNTALVGLFGWQVHVCMYT